MQMRFHPDLLTMIKLEWKTVEVVNQFTRYTLLKCCYMQLTTLIIIEKKVIWKRNMKKKVCTLHPVFAHGVTPATLQMITVCNTFSKKIPASTVPRYTLVSPLLHLANFCIKLPYTCPHRTGNTHTIFWF